MREEKAKVTLKVSIDAAADVPRRRSRTPRNQVPRRRSFRRRPSARLTGARPRASAAFTAAWPDSLERRDRQAHRRAAAAELLERPLGRRRARLDEQHLVQREQLQLQSRRGARVAGERRRADRLDRARRDVGRDADAAVAAEQHQRDRRIVVAGIDREAGRRAAQDRAAARDVAGRVLDADRRLGPAPAAGRSRPACRRPCAKARCRAPSGCRRPRRSPGSGGRCLPATACCSRARPRACSRRRP